MEGNEVMEVTQTTPVQPVGSGGGQGGGAGPGGGKKDDKEHQEEAARKGHGPGHTEPAISISGILSMAGLSPEAQHALERMAGEVEPLRRHLAQAQADLAEAREQAQRHPVVPCANRRGVLAGLEKLIHRLGQVEARPSLILVHLANGDDIRRTQGRRALDEALGKVAAFLADDDQQAMLTGNIGGNDFALVLLESGPDAARRKADDLVRALAAVHTASGIYLRALTGVATLEPGMTAEAALDAADRDLL